MNLPERMIHQSTRWILGRATYAVSEHCDWLIENWDRIPESERRIIERDVESEFERAERVKSIDPALGGPLGMDMDRACWSQVRSLWKNQDQAPAPEPDILNQTESG
jgi:hypothetical protein